MFQSISWADFLSVLSLIVLGYYAILGLALYNSEISSFFKQRMHRSASTLNHNQSKSHQADVIMGSVKSDSSREPVSREASIEVHELMALREEDGEAVEVAKGEQRLADQQNLLDEIQTVLGVLQAGSAGETTTLFRALLARYDHLTHATYREHVSVIIHSGCNQRGLSFALDEVRLWWPSH